MVKLNTQVCLSCIVTLLNYLLLVITTMDKVFCVTRREKYTREIL